MDGSAVNEAQLAAQIWEDAQPYAPPGVIAFWVRNNIPLPDVQTPITAPDIPKILQICTPPWIAQRYGFGYLQFTCPRCKMSVYTQANDWGMNNVRAIAARHQSNDHPARKQSFCDQRKGMGENIWPDSLES